MIEKLKELSKETALYGISTILSRFLNFLLVPLYTNIFNEAANGIIANIYAYIAFLNIIYIYGMDVSFMKYSSLAASEEKKDVFSTPFITVVLSSIALSIVFLLGQNTFAGILHLPERLHYLIYSIVGILLFDALALIPFADLRLKKKALKFALLKSLNISINLGLNLVLILGFDLGIEGVIYSNLAASVITFILLLPDIFANFKPSVKKELLGKFFRFGIPYLPASIAAVLIQVVDRPILLNLTSEETLGVYQANYKLGIFMMLFVSMFQYAWQPFFLTNAKEKNAKEIFSKVLTIFVIIASGIWITLSLFVENIVKLDLPGGWNLVGENFWGGLEIVPVILLAYVFHGMYVNFQAGIYIEEKTKFFPVVTILGALANVISNLILIPAFGLMGAAYSTLLSYLIMAAGLNFFSQKYYKINYEYGKIFRVIFLIIATGIIYYFLLYNGYLNLPIKLLMFAGFFVMLALLNVIKINEIRTVLKSLSRKG